MVETLPGAPSNPVPRPLEFEAVYANEFAFVWRNLRRLGVPETSLRDAAQDVFLVVHRRLGEFEGRGSLRSWLYSILKRVAGQQRRTERRKHAHDMEDSHDVADIGSPSPERDAERREAARLLRSLLEGLDEDKRDAFVLAELEGMTVPEIAQALGANANTIYARIRAARQLLQAALREHQARERRPA